MWSKEVNDGECEGGFELTPTTLKKLCRDLKLYSSCPELNEVIHLHQKGIVKLKNLDEYTGLRTIYLECNAISKIEGLDRLVNIQCLYLNENLVENICGLDKLMELETLDLANNQIKKIQGLAGCTKLRQLNLSGNRIRSLEDTIHLKDCGSIQSLDLSNNRIDDELALEMIRSIPLRLLRLIGNPIVSKTRHYRKKTITSIQELHYLDDAPVFEKDRRLAEAWRAGGLPAEQETREIIRKEEADMREKHLKAFDELVQNAKACAQDKAMQGRKTFEAKDNIMAFTTESNSSQQASVKNDSRLVPQVDLMEEEDTTELHSQGLEPRKRDAMTFNSHCQDVMSPQKVRKCGMSMESIHFNGCGLVADSTNMETDMTFPRTNFLDLYLTDNLSSGSNKIAHQRKEDGDSAIVLPNDEISMVHSELASSEVHCNSKFPCQRSPNFGQEELLRAVEISNDSRKSDIIITC
ncbi:unnamed protein product [Calypogeia fissa]